MQIERRDRLKKFDFDEILTHRDKFISLNFSPDLLFQRRFYFIRKINYPDAWWLHFRFSIVRDLYASTSVKSVIRQPRSVESMLSNDGSGIVNLRCAAASRNCGDI